MNILTDNTVSEINGYTYNSFNFQVENTDVSILVVTGNHSYVNVCVKNAMHKAFRGAGRMFTDLNEALANYKNPKIKAAITYVISN